MRRSVFDQCGEVDGVGHGLVSLVAGMQVVAGIEFGQQACRMRRIAQQEVEIDHGIEGAAGADQSLTFWRSASFSGV